MRLNWGKTFVLGFGFLAVSAVWPLYDSYMPHFLEQFIASSTLIGVVMGFDNFLGLTLTPWVGALSDRTRSKWGRRRPYLLVGMPVAAVCLSLLVFTHDAGLAPLLLTTGTLNVAMAFFRSPVVALMPDLTPAPLHSVANGIINFMGGIGAAVVLLGGQYLYKANPGYPFLAAAVIMVVVFFLFLLVIREPEVPPVDASADETPQSLLAALKHIVTHRDSNTLRLFSAIFAYFMGYQAVNTWFAQYTVDRFNVPINTASGALLAYVASFIIFALPAGYIGTWLGRKRTMALGIAGMMLSFGTMHFLSSLNQMMVALVIGGFCWSLININAYPLVVQQCHPSQTGTYTGLYYIFQGVAGAIAPSVAGALFDLWGSKQPLFPLAVLFMGIALALMLSVGKDKAGRLSDEQAALGS